jgi:hypothetical protein
MTRLALLMAVIMSIGILPVPAYAACSDAAATIKTLEAERQALEAEIRALQQLMQRIELALKEDTDDGGLIKDVKNLFGDQPSYELQQLQKLVAVQLANRMTRLKWISSQLSSALAELQRCAEPAQPLLRPYRDQSTSIRRPAPSSLDSVITQERGERDSSYTPPPGAGLGDGWP